MESFKDTKARIWVIDMNFGSVKRVRALCGVDLLSILERDAELLSRLHTDLVLLVDVLFALVKPEADRLGVTDDEFGRSFSGDVLLEASDALTKAVVSFLPRPEVRAAATTLVAKGKRLGDLLAAELGPMLDLINPDQMAARAIEKSRRQLANWNGSSGSTLESPASTRTPSPSDN